MKFQSVACIWSSSPPSQHRVTALDRPPTLYPGSADAPSSGGTYPSLFLIPIPVRALAAFYSQNFTEKVLDIKPPSLQVINSILQTIDPSNAVLHKNCFQTPIVALKEVVRVFPMVALDETSTRLAVGDAIGDMSNSSIQVFDMQSVMKIKVLDVSPLPRLPILLSGNSETDMTILVSALCFSLDREGLVAFSENGLMIRWWSLGSVWWEKLSRNFVPVQWTKVIFVSPLEGFSSKTARKCDGEHNVP